MGRSKGLDGLASQVNNSPGLNQEWNGKAIALYLAYTVKQFESRLFFFFFAFFHCLERCYKHRSKSKHLTVILYGILHKVLDWVAMAFSRASS